MSQLDDQKIKELLKKSPPLTPPESFYRGVMEKINAPSGAHAPAPTPWFLGYPVKAFATACVLVVIVLVARDKKSSEPERSPQNTEFESNPTADKNKALDTPASVSKAREKSVDLANTKEVQDRVNRSITGYVDNPSPFEDVDEKAGHDLVPQLKDASAPPAGSSYNFGVANRKSVAASPLQARDTVNGIASQGSFLQGQQDFSKKQANVRAENLDAAVQNETMPWKGSNSGIAEPRKVVIRSQDSWNQLWQEHSQGQSFSSIPPVVDFNQYDVVAIFAGTSPGLSGIHIDHTETTLDRVIVYYKEEPLISAPGVTSVANRPYHLLLIPKTTLPVIFQKQQ